MMWLVDSLGWTETLVLALIVITALYLRHGRGKAYNLPPGPWPLPVIGNVLTFALSKKSVFDQLTSLSEKYGPIFKVQFGGVKAVVLNNLTLANEALLTKPTDFAGRPHSYSMDIITQGGKDIALADYGPTWRLQRKIASKAFRAYLTGTQLELRVHKAVSDVIDVIKVEKGPLLVKDYLSLLVMNFICAFCFGTSYKMDDKELKDQLDVLDTFLETSANGLPEDFLPALRHLRLKGSTTLFKKVDEFRGFVEKHYKEHQGSFDSGNIRDFTDCLIAAEKEAQSEEEATELSKLTQIHFTQTLADIFSAGVDTSRYTLAWTILYCVAFPELQEKVHREIMAVVGPSRMPGINDKKKLPYTEAFLHESMRLGTVAPGGFPHCAMVDGQIGGYDVPKGFLVTINHWWLHHDPAVWPEPETFRPERFLNEDGSLAPKPENFLPFSMGRRVCLGEAVAKPELLLMFAGLLHKLKFSLPPGETANLEPVGGLAGLIPHPYKVIVESRF